MSAGDLAKALGGRRMNGYFVARCPAHEDKNPSLSITDRDGRVLVRCHAGCSQADVIAALKARELWIRSGESTKPYLVGSSGFRRTKKGLRKSEDLKGDRRTVVATYTYTDERGSPLYRVVRTEPKGFYQERWTGGRWATGLGGTRRVLYRLPEVREAAIVFLAEGEKDAEALRERGFVATTAAGGAQAQWLQSYTEALLGKEVIVIPDNDVPGWTRAVKVCRELVGKVARLRIHELPEDIKDVSDWFAAGHSEVELIESLERSPHAV